MTGKMKLMSALLGAVLLACTGCGGGSSVTDGVSQAADTTTSAADTTAAAAQTTTAAASSAADTTAAPADTTPKPADTTEAPAETTTKPADTGSASAELTAAQAKEVMAALQKVDGWGASLIEMDTETTVTQNDTVYCKVTDAAFKTTEDVRKFMNDHMTEDFIRDNYSTLLGGEKPFFIDSDGALYVQNYPRGYKYIFTDTAPTLEKTMADGYTVYCFIADMGQEQAVMLFVNNVDGAWKLSGISFGM